MFQQKPEDRLRSWREFRSTLDLIPLEQALAQTAEYWARAPFTPYYLDPDDPSRWPDPWALIMENTYCDVAKCLGIMYTISLTAHKKELDIEHRIYIDHKKNHLYNLAWFAQGKYILNLIDGTVVNIKQLSDSLELKCIYTATELQLTNY
jgi:hypothetical protein